MKKNRALVTGANGYIGSRVVAELIRRGYQTVACDLNFDFVPEGAERLSADIFDPSVDIFSLAGEPDLLIHLAWRNGFQHNAPSHLSDLPLHLAFLQRMIEDGVSSLSVMGSMHEIGYWEGAICGDTPANPQSFYGIAKNSLRQALELAVKGKNVSFHWLRGFYIFGDDERSQSIFGKILSADRKGQEYFPFTSGKNLYDFISVQELAEQIVSASLQSEFQGIINCCSGIPVSLGSMVERFIQENKLSIKLQYGAYPDRPYDSPGVWGDSTIIREILAKEKV